MENVVLHHVVNPVLAVSVVGFAFGGGLRRTPVQREQPDSVGVGGELETRGLTNQMREY